MKKIIALIVMVILLSVIAVVVMLNSKNTIVPEEPITRISGEKFDNQSSGEIKKEKDYKDKAILYFYNGSFAGYLKNGIWYDSDDVLLEQIFDNEYYSMYMDDTSPKQTSHKMVLSFDSGYGSFSYEGISFDTTDEYFQVENNLSKYGEVGEFGFVVFKLPVKLDEELAKSITNSLYDSELSAVRIVPDDVNESYYNHVALIAYNADFDLKFADRKNGPNTVPDDIKELLAEKFEEEGLNPKAEYVISDYYECDLNKDGKTDEVYNIASKDVAIIHESNIDEAHNQLYENGGFSAIITKINGKAEILLDSYVSLEDIKESDYDMVGSTENYDVCVVDLNEDDIYEIIVTTYGWEYTYLDLFVYQKDRYDYPLSSPFYIFNEYSQGALNYVEADAEDFNDVKYTGPKAMVREYIDKARKYAIANDDKQIVVYTQLSNPELNKDYCYVILQTYEKDLDENDVSTLEEKVSKFMHSEYAHEPMYEKSPRYDSWQEYDISLPGEEEYIVRATGELWMIDFDENGNIEKETRLYPGET